MKESWHKTMVNKKSARNVSEYFNVAFLAIFFVFFAVKLWKGGF